MKFRRPVAIALSSLAVTACALITELQGVGSDEAAAISYPTAVIDGTSAPYVVRILERKDDAHHLSMVNRDTHCTGTLVAEQYVVTAAHCIDSRFESDYTITVGRRTYDNWTCAVTGIRKHERYTSGVISVNDIAVLRITKGCGLSRYPRLAGANSRSSNLQLYGWGMNQDKQLPEQLARLSVEREDGIAASLYGNAFNPAVQIAAAHFFVKEQLYGGACFGDSGGPLLSTAGGLTLIGVVNWGTTYRKTCLVTGPTVFSKITYYRKWILGAEKALARSSKSTELYYEGDLGTGWDPPSSGFTSVSAVSKSDVFELQWFFIPSVVTAPAPNFELYYTGPNSYVRIRAQNPDLIGDWTGIYGPDGSLKCAPLFDKTEGSMRTIGYPMSCVAAGGMTAELIAMSITPRNPEASYDDWFNHRIMGSTGYEISSVGFF